MLTINDIRKYMDFREQAFPLDPQKALNYFISEVGELFDARMRRDSTQPWKRNNPNKEFNVEFEYGDCYQMLQIACYSETGKTLEECLLDKWKSKGYVHVE